ncbi:protein translocase subunit SecF [Paenibacillus sp. MSJ-34]|uniref:protein translocase subunit SecF n=1 Tax=Paenibacillus sp. MSJ-34 TaxID=2841529 RepID=UPI001C119652|nr:protein translocase subunit SecF [Paenibacillus sp. MSJ-34]
MRSKWDFNFVKASKYCFTFSIVITLLGAIMLGVLGLNYGVDFSAGSNVDISVNKPVAQADVEQFLQEQGFEKIPPIIVGADRVTIRFPEVLNDQQEHKLKEDFSAKFDAGASYEVNTVDVEMAKELQRNALIAVLLASVGIIIYVSIRFEWRFAIAAIVSLLHVAFFVISIFSVFRLEVNLPFIIAILTIIGYAINDTVVIFDRIRENLRFAKIKGRDDLVKLVNRSVSQSMTRSVNTVLTVLFVAVCLFVFGSESIRLFSLAMVIGLICGAYSSIFIASPLWVLLKDKQKPKAKTAAKATT